LHNQFVKISFQKKGIKMKNIYKFSSKAFIIFSLLVCCSNICLSQIYPWSPLQKITSGFYDRNPSFGTKQQYFAMLFDWEFMIFERHQDSHDSASNICVLKIGTEGPIDSVFYISDNSVLSRNPSISYSGNSTFFQTSIRTSLAVWESKRNGRWDIYASYYTTGTGWQTPFAVDTSAFDKFLPKSVSYDSINYAITYEKNNDIIFRIINGQTHNVSYDTNLTANESAICNTPFIIYDFSSYYVSYQKQKADNDFEIDFRKSNSLPNWTQADTIAYEGNNLNNGFVATFNEPTGIFVSDRLGNYNIYGTAINFFSGQKPIVIDTLSENYDYESYLFPIITDGGFYNHANAYIKKTDSVRIILGEYFSQQDSVAVSDSTSGVSLTMNRGLKYGLYDALVWVVFNKDSLSYSGLYGKSLQVIITDIKQTSNSIPQKFELYQNYPNPFNPITKIKFDIPQIVGNTASDVKLIIYDQLGREVESLLDKQLGSGTYEVTWDAGKYSSGIYFYKLVSGNFSDTKKLMLLK
jgi:hypothetical protein